jgi:hypothetical protein
LEKEFYKKKSEVDGRTGRVSIVTKLKQKYVSKREYSNFCMTIGLHKFARIADGVSHEKGGISNLYEDVFEAFFGALESVINKRYPFTGYGAVYKILEPILRGLNNDFLMAFNDPIKYLIDPKTMVNEKINKMNKLPQNIPILKGSLRLLYNKYPSTVGYKELRPEFVIERGKTKIPIHDFKSFTYNGTFHDLSNVPLAGVGPLEQEFASYFYNEYLPKYAETMNLSVPYDN